MLTASILPVAQVVQSKALNENMARKLRGNSQYLANLEARLQHEIVKAAPVLSSNLDGLPTVQLQQLVAAQEEALKRARSMLVTSLACPCSCYCYLLHCSAHDPATTPMKVFVQVSHSLSAAGDALTVFPV